MCFVSDGVACSGNEVLPVWATGVACSGNDFSLPVVASPGNVFPFWDRPLDFNCVARLGNAFRVSGDHCAGRLTL